MYEQMGPSAEPDVDLMGDTEREPSDPAEVLRLRLKRRYKMQLIKKILQDAGYDDLAKMTTVKSEKPY
jgi:hypothetical protein